MAAGCKAAHWLTMKETVELKWSAVLELHLGVKWVSVPSSVMKGKETEGTGTVHR